MRAPLEHSLIYKTLRVCKVSSRSDTDGLIRSGVREGVVHLLSFPSPPILSLSLYPSLPPLQLLPSPLAPPLPLRGRPLRYSEGYGERCKLPQRGGGPAEIEFGAF